MVLLMKTPQYKGARLTLRVYRGGHDIFCSIESSDLGDFLRRVSAGISMVIFSSVPR